MLHHYEKQIWQQVTAVASTDAEYAPNDDAPTTRANSMHELALIDKIDKN